MKIIKIGIRRNMLYPFLFILFTSVRRVDKYFLTQNLGNVKTTFTQISVMILSSFIVSLIFVLYNKKNKTKSKKNDTNNINRINFIQNKPEYQIPDNEYKVIILIFFAAFFEFFGFLSRRFITLYNLDDDNYDEFNAKFRGLEIISASILCYFTLRIEIYKHHIFSLIVIIFCLITNSLLEREEGETFLYKINIVIVGSLSRAYLDTIEKYLFEVDYINMFSLILLEQCFNLIFCSSLYFHHKPRKQLSQLIDLCVKDKVVEGKKRKGNGIVSIILLIIYGILTAFKNIYRRFTVKQYSPMSRALAESCIDPLLIIFESLEDDNKKMDKYFIITLISTFIIIFCCCVYNEALILYCCDLDYNTYFEISNRAKLINDNNIRNSSINMNDINEANINDKENEIIDKKDNESQN